MLSESLTEKWFLKEKKESFPYDCYFRRREDPQGWASWRDLNAHPLLTGIFFKRPLFLSFFQEDSRHGRVVFLFFFMWHAQWLSSWKEKKRNRNGLLTPVAVSWRTSLYIFNHTLPLPSYWLYDSRYRLAIQDYMLSFQLFSHYLLLES